jgi:hypothetical protein
MRGQITVLLMLIFFEALYAPYPPPDPSTNAQRLFTAEMHGAIHAGDLEKVKQLLENKAMLESYKENGNYSPLKDALTSFEARPTFVPIIRLIIENNVDVRRDDIPFLAITTRRGLINMENGEEIRLKLASLLLEHGANPHLAYDGLSASDFILYGLTHNPTPERPTRFRLFRLLLAHGVCNQYLNTKRARYQPIFSEALPELLRAIISRDDKRVESLLTSGRDVEVCDKEGRNAFFYAKNRGVGSELDTLLATHINDKRAAVQR